MATVGIGSKSPMKKSPGDKIPHDKIPHDRILHVKIPRAVPNIRQTRRCMRYYNRLRALLYLVVCATILGCVHYYIRLCALLY